MSTIDWKKIRDTQVPPIAEDDPALSAVRKQLEYLDKYPPTELRQQFRQNLLDEIERYRWQKAGFEPTQEMLEACRDK